jgi:magnesium transporter
MTQTPTQSPLDQLRVLVEQGQPSEIEAFLDALRPGPLMAVLTRLGLDDQRRLLSCLDPEDAAHLVERLPDAQAAEMVERLEPAPAAAIVSELWSAEQADLLGGMTELHKEAILAAMDPEEAQAARELSTYPSDSAGGLMITEHLAYAQSMSVGGVVEDLRQNRDHYAHYEIQYAYVRDSAGKLVGVLRLRDLLIAAPTTLLEDVMIPNPVSVSVSAGLEQLQEFFRRHGFLGAPAVDEEGKVKGVVRRADVQEELAHRADRTYALSQGIVGGEELRTMPLLVRSRRRLSWLGLNIVLNLIAASIIGFYQDTLTQVIALAVFLPIISDMSGCSGNQAVAVSIRELTLGVSGGRWQVLRVLGQEALLGLINGVALGLLVGAAAYLWKRNLALSGVVAGALALNTLVAVCIGGAIPLLLKRGGFDPALASGPILTTVTDMCGFLLVLSLATAALAYLVPVVA